MAAFVRFLQCAGCCFDSPSWQGPQEWSTQRNQDLWHSFEAMVSLCRSEKVELLFLTGDLFDQDYVHKETVERVTRSLATLKSTKIFIAPGDRDPFVATSAYRLAVWPSNVHIFSSEISCVKIPSHNITVYGAGWTAYQQEGPVLEGFQTKRDGTISMMLLHAEVKSVINTEGFIPILPEYIASSGLAYLALGHQESWSGIQNVGETVWSDSGYLEARGFGQSGPHGVILGEIKQDSVRIEFRELGKRHYIEKTLTIPANIETLMNKLMIETSVEERRRDLFRIKLSGSFQNVEALVHPLQMLLADKFRFVEVVHNEDITNRQSGEEVDSQLNSRVGNWDTHHTLTQLFVSRLKELQDSAVDAETHKHWQLVMKIGLAALGQGRLDDEN
ncbi:MAG TPA: hypothetical protein VFC84_20860 [Desulfosporosinus sp.]|nr:hypothetical protein [Desulfosporosinus sp.]